MAFLLPSLSVLFALNVVLGALFIYAVYEAIQLSNSNVDAATEIRPPWAESLVTVVCALLNLLLVAIAISLACRYYYGL